MEGWEDPFNRAGYPWEQEDTDLKAHFAELARFRRSFPHCKPAFFIGSGPPVPC